VAEFHQFYEMQHHLTEITRSCKVAGIHQAYLMKVIPSL